MQIFLDAFDDIPDPRARNTRHDLGELLVAVLRRRALDVVRRDTSKDSLSIKLERAGWDDEYLRSILGGLAA